MHTASGQEEVETLDITMDLSNMDANVDMDEVMHNNESTVTSIVTTSTALPPPSSPIPTFVPVSTISPTFSGIMQEPIATIFSYQSTEKSQHENETDDEDVMVSFADLQFDLEVENIPDEMTMSGKQFKI